MMTPNKPTDSKFTQDALSIRVLNTSKSRDDSWEFKARLPILEVLGYALYLSWIFLTYWGEPLAPLSMFSDQQTHILRITMIAVVALMYLAVGILAKPFATKNGSTLLIILTMVFAPMNCYVFLIPGGSAYALIFWALTGIGHGTILLLWSKHLVLFTRRQLILITSISFVIAGLVYISTNYLQPALAIVIIGILPVLSLIFFVLGSRDADERIADLKQAARPTSKKPLVQLYVFSAAYCIALGFMGACITIEEFQQQSIVPVGIANVLAGAAMLFVLMRYKRDVARVSALIFLPCMALGMFLFAFLGTGGRLVCLGFLFFLFACNDVINITTVSKSSPLYGVNYVRTFGIGRFPNGIGVLLGWLLAYAIFYISSQPESGIIIVSFLLVVVFVFVKTITFESERKKPIASTNHGSAVMPPSVTPSEALSGLTAADPDNDSQTVTDPVTASAQRLIIQYQLSARQSEVLHLLAKGRNAEHIQEKLFISNHTAKSHIYSIYRKLDVHSQQDLINMIESGID